MALAKWRHVGLLTLAWGLLLPTAVFAQSSGIAGVVKDATGAVIPGITVEAASPALIEKVRSVVTDSAGEYKIVSLPPGVYTVTFSLTGFNPIKREGIELTTGFTATVNAEMRVGNVAETIVVSGQSPVVDTQNVVQQRVLTRDVLDAVPTGKALAGLGALIPGIAVNQAGSGGTTADVGGSNGERTQTLSIHGARDGDVLFDNLPVDSLAVGGGRGSGGNATYANNGALQEVSFQTDSNPAEYPYGGVHSNMIPRDGGDKYTGFLFVSGTNNNFESKNLSSSLIARGLTTVSAVDKIWDINPSFGGPLKTGRLWFYLSARYWGTYTLVANDYANEVNYQQNPQSFAYIPNMSQQAVDDLWNGAQTLRLSGQATPRNKIGVYIQEEQRCSCHDSMIQGSLTRTPEAAYQEHNVPSYIVQATWNAPVTNRFLIEAGAQTLVVNHPDVPQSSAAPDQIGVTEATTNLNYRANNASGDLVHSLYESNTFNYRLTASYVTGSQNLKVGLQQIWAGPRQFNTGPSLAYTLLNGSPTSLTMFATPLNYSDHVMEGGLFAQDQWTVKRMTLNLGVRYDFEGSSIPAQEHAAGMFVPARSYQAVDNVTNWKDVSPRFGVAYDLFGNGKTAIKVSVGRYIDGVTSGTVITQAENPQVTQVNSATRAWHDTNGNFSPDCNLLLPAANGECGGLSPSTFGQSFVTTTYDPAVTHGFDHRPYDWEFSTGIQHEVLPSVSVGANYYRRWYDNIISNTIPSSFAGQGALLVQNQATTPANFDPYCVTAPLDPRLPGGGGYQVCGLYNVTPSKFGQTSNFVTYASNFGSVSDVYNGVDLTVNARLPHGVLLQGGTSTGHEVLDRCVVVNSPQDLLNCKIAPPFRTQLKLVGSYPLPWGLMVSGVFQHIPGPEIDANYLATSASVAQSLGRPLAGGASTVTVPLIPPGTMFEAALNQVDVRLAKNLTLGRFRVRPQIDVYNLLNAAPVLSENLTYGSSWQRPTSVLAGRLLKLGAQIDF